MRLEALLNRQFREELEREAEVRKFAKAVFEDWRRQYMAHLAAYIRYIGEMRRRNVPIPNNAESIPWCNAALLIMDSAPLDLRDVFMRSNRAHKDEIVKAVLADGGVTNLNGYFLELPPL